MTATTRTALKWKAALALIFIIIASIMNWNWVWGILFIFWAINDLILGETHLVERITRADNPPIYWLTIVAWFVLSAFMFVPEAFWQSLGG